eukprot:SAG31_NODE_5975_length_2230_cov_1.133271_1_plen_551_part_10
MSPGHAVAAPRAELYMPTERGTKSEVRGLLDDLDARQEWQHTSSTVAADGAKTPTKISCMGGNECRLRLAMWLNVGYAIAELVAYFKWGSLSMLTDAFHNGSDVIALLIALYCEHMKKSVAAKWTQQMTFGPKRYEAIGGFANGLLLLGLRFYIVLDAIPRLWRPPVLDGSQEWVVIAAIGVPVNLLSAALLCRSDITVAHAHSHGDGTMHSHDGTAANFNMLAVLLHSLGDAVTSVVVTVIAFFIADDGRAYSRGSCADGYVLIDPGWHGGAAVHIDRQAEVHCRWTDYLDPVASIILALGISLTVFPLLRQTWPIVLDAAPSYIDLRRLRRELSAISGVAAVGAVHVWSADAVGGGGLAAIVHIFVEPPPPLNRLPSPRRCNAPVVGDGGSPTLDRSDFTSSRSTDAALEESGIEIDGSWALGSDASRGSGNDAERNVIGLAASERSVRRRVWALLHDEYDIERVTIQVLPLKPHTTMSAGLQASQRQTLHQAAAQHCGWASQWAAAAATQGVLLGAELPDLDERTDVDAENSSVTGKDMPIAESLPLA